MMHGHIQSFSRVLAATESIDAYPHPALPAAALWPGVMVIIILLGFIATAAVLGPIVRALMRDPVPPTGLRQAGRPGGDFSPPMVKPHPPSAR